jgi:hypothetical protein
MLYGKGCTVGRKGNKNSNYNCKKCLLLMFLESNQICSFYLWTNILCRQAQLNTLLTVYKHSYLLSLNHSGLEIPEFKADVVLQNSLCTGKCLKMMCKLYPVGLFSFEGTVSHYIPQHTKYHIYMCIGYNPVLRNSICTFTPSHKISQHIFKKLRLSTCFKIACITRSGMIHAEVFTVLFTFRDCFLCWSQL